MTNDLILIISNVFTAVSSFLVGRRRANADTDNTILKNLEISINIYREIINDLKKEIEGLNIRIQDLEKKVDELHQENKQLRANL